MNNLLIVSLICLSAIYLVNGIKLTNLCKEDVFKFQENNNSHIEHRTINSFYKLSLSKVLPKVKHYMVSTLENPTFLNEADHKAMVSFVYNYEKLLLDVYSERFTDHLNNMQKNVIFEKYQYYLQYQNEIKEVLNHEKGYPEKETTTVLNLYLKNMQRIEDLLKIYLFGRVNRLTVMLHEHEKLEEELNKFHDGLTDYQVPSFDGLFSYAYFEHRVLKITGFKLDRASRMFFSKNSYGTINFDIYIPFENLKYDQEIEKGNCVKSKGNLPLFYTKKGITEDEE